MKLLSTQDILGLAADSDIVQLLRASELNLAEVLTMLSNGPETTFVRDAHGLRFLKRVRPPESTVILTHWAERDIEPLLDVELARLEAFGAPVDWQLYGGASQAELAVRLARRGLTAGSNCWMLADLAALPEPPSVPPELRMAVADTPAGMEDWQRGFAAGFSVIDSTAGDYHAAYTQSLENRIHYVGYVGDAPVAIAMLLCAADVACLWDIATAPESRRKGYAACLTRVALDDARRRGHRHATLNASRLGRSVYASVGFSLTCEVPEFRFESGS